MSLCVHVTAATLLVHSAGRVIQLDAYDDVLAAIAKTARKNVTLLALNYNSQSFIFGVKVPRLPCTEPRYPLFQMVGIVWNRVVRLDPHIVQDVQPCS